MNSDECNKEEENDSENENLADLAHNNSSMAQERNKEELQKLQNVIKEETNDKEKLKEESEEKDLQKEKLEETFTEKDRQLAERELAHLVKEPNLAHNNSSMAQERYGEELQKLQNLFKEQKNDMEKLKEELKEQDLRIKNLEEKDRQLAERELAHLVKEPNLAHNNSSMAQERNKEELQKLQNVIKEETNDIEKQKEESKEKDLQKEKLEETVTEKDRQLAERELAHLVKEPNLAHNNSSMAQERYGEELQKLQNLFKEQKNDMEKLKEELKEQDLRIKNLEEKDRQLAERELAHLVKEPNLAHNNSSMAQERYGEELQKLQNLFKEQKNDMEKLKEELKEQDLRIKNLEEKDRQLAERELAHLVKEPNLAHNNSSMAQERYEEELQKLQKVFKEQNNDMEKLKEELKEQDLRIKYLEEKDRQLAERELAHLVKEPTTAQLYTEHNGETIRCIEKELKTKLKDKARGINIIRRTKKTDIDTSQRLIVLSIITSRLGIDAANAIKDIKDHKNTVLVLIHMMGSHALPEQRSADVLHDQKFRDLRRIFDLAYESEKGIYQCTMNEATIEGICSYINDSAV